MGRKCKPRAYLRKEMIGYVSFKPVDRWVAREWRVGGKYVAMGGTKKECEAECRERGYVPERY